MSTRNIWASALATSLTLMGSPACTDASSSSSPPSTPLSSPQSTATSSTTTTNPRSGFPDCSTPDPTCVTSAGSLRMRVTGTATAPTSVAPVDGDPLATIDRDAGVAVRLSDGSTLWLFGDTAARDDAGQLTYFVIGTASWAPAVQPTVTRDAVDPATGEPARFARPTPDFPTCPHADQEQGMWPSAAVVQPVGNRDRVLVWMENVCLGQNQKLNDAGMSIAEWWYDPATPPDRSPIVATMLNQRLFPNRSYGSAVLPGRELETSDGTGTTDRELFIYRCGTTTVGGPPEAYGPCHVARTTIAGAADPSTYREWDGTGYRASVGAGTPLPLPGGRTALHPPAGFSVVDDPAVGGLVMIYSPWPGPSAYVDVRVAEQPEGPWSPPVTVTLQGCDDRIGERVNRCYAGNAQPWRSTPGNLGIGYYDSQVSTFPLRGRFQVATVPIVAN